VRRLDFFQNGGAMREKCLHAQVKNHIDEEKPKEEDAGMQTEMFV